MEEEKDKLASRNVVVNISILDRKFTYTVPQEDESLIRNTIKDLSERLMNLKRRKNFHDNQEHLTVALVQIAIEKARLEAELGDVRDNIRLLDSQLDEYIENNVK
ncbi:MAG TPA: cell division protein ZapA [Candidatus Coprenecus stercoravium]|uniref:Cell division protein ZapA n=1 Tax=Candidatus Coprenecus stercoravium TaxID=2840735 RepID=A0A9D2K9J4_9BACT|nr:cell division protein ZapA [Candidatus Coprenecus stercoravium]